MRRYYEFWLWLGAALVASALAAVAVAGGFVASRDNYAFWAGAPMIFAYVCGAAALVCFMAALRDAPFPFVADSHAAAVRQQNEIRGTLDGAIKAINGCIVNAEATRVMLFDTSQDETTRIKAYNDWFARSCAALGNHSPIDLPSFQRSLSPPLVDYVGVVPIRAPISGFISQLDARRDMLVHVVERLQTQRVRT